MKIKFLFATLLVDFLSLTCHASDCAAFFGDLTSSETFNSFTIIDANKDGRSWVYDSVSNQTLYPPTPVIEANDWLVTPPVALERDSFYRIEANIGTVSSYSFEKIDLMMGTDISDLSALQSILKSSPLVITGAHSPFRAVSPAFKPTDDTTLRFALVALTAKNSGGIIANNISVSKISPFSPSQVTNLSVYSENSNNRNVILSFMAPDTDISGSHLDKNISRIEIRRGDKLVGTVHNCSPGTRIYLTDSDKDIRDGWNTYTITPFSDGIEGDSNYAKIFIGTDIPMTPENFTAVDRETYVSLYWNTVDYIGENGGSVLPYNVYYNVYRAEPIFENGQLKQTLLTFLKRIKGSRTDCDVHQLSEGMVEPIYFALTAENTTGESTPTFVKLLKGQPSALPFHETFNGNGLNSYLEISTDCKPDGYDITIHSEPQNEASIALNCKEDDRYIAITTTKIKLNSSDEPKLKFRAKNTQGINRLDVNAHTPDGTIQELMSTFPPAEYEEFIIDLSELNHHRWVRLEFRTTYTNPDPEQGNQTNIGAIYIYDKEFQDNIIQVTDDTTEQTKIYTLDGHQIKESTEPSDAPHRILIINGKKYLFQ